MLMLHERYAPGAAVEQAIIQNAEEAGIVTRGAWWSPWQQYVQLRESYAYDRRTLSVPQCAEAEVSAVASAVTPPPY